MGRAVEFYECLGFRSNYGGHDATFTSFYAGNSHLNLILQPERKTWKWWGRVIIFVDNVDAMHRRAMEAGLTPTTEPRDAEWGERYFHITDPDGHELSFAKRLGD